MKKWNSFLLLAFMLVSPIAYADISLEARESLGGTVAVTDTAQTVILGDKTHVAIVNDGTDEVYIRFNSTIDADDGDFSVQLEERVAFDASNGKVFNSMSVACDTGETATIRWISWD